jgi:glycosyltransferase involved in cell wall biosynthesis
LSPARVHVKPNFVAERRPAEKRSGQNAQFTFVGSIRKEKGIDLLLQAWIKAQPKGYRLVLLGDGPDRAELQRQYASEESVVWMGFRSALEVARALKNSKYIAVCSRWYEGFPMVLLEAFRSGTPAIAPDHAAFPEIVERGKCGFLFEPSNLDSLTDALHTAASVSERVWREQSNSALRKAEEYSAAANYVRLMEIYGAAREHYSRKQ